MSELEDLICDLLAGESDHALASAYLESFLPRWSRRVEKGYSPRDAFAAACIGSRRLVQHLGLSRHSLTILSIERTLARAVAAGIIDTATLSDAVDQYTLEKVARSNPYDDSIYLKHVRGERRDKEVERIALICLGRADEWTPEVAQESSRARKHPRRERGLSLYGEVEVARMARVSNVQSDTNSLTEHYPRKMYASSARSQDSHLQSQKQSNPNTIIKPQRKKSSDSVITSIRPFGVDALVPMQRSESLTEEPKRKWYQRKAPQSKLSPLSSPHLAMQTPNMQSDSFHRIPMDISMQRSQSNDSFAFLSNLNQSIKYDHRRPSTDPITPLLNPRKQSIESSPLLRVCKYPGMISTAVMDQESEARSLTGLESIQSGSSEGGYEYRRKHSFTGSTVLESLSEVVLSDCAGVVRDGYAQRAVGDVGYGVEGHVTSVVGDASCGVRRGSAEAMLQLLQDEIESMHFDDIQ